MGKAGSAVGGAVSGAASGAGAGAALGPIGSAVGGVIGGIGGLIGGLFGGGSDAEEKQAELLAQISADIDELNKTYPPEEAQRIALERYKSAGVLTPEMEQVITQGPSRMEQISVAPKTKEAQLAALAKLQQIGGEGMTLEQRAEQNQLLREVARQEQSRQQGIIQGMQQRGISGSGAEAALQGMSSQSAADRASQEAMQTAAQGRAQALQAIMQGGQLGSQMREQEFGEKSQVAQAADAIARMNAANRQGVETRNVGSRNVAQEANLRMEQDIANKNVGLSNQEQQYNKELKRQKYLDMLSAQRAKAGGQQAEAEMYGKRAAADKQSTADIISGIGGGLTSIGKYGSEQGWFKSKPEEPTSQPVGPAEEGSVTPVFGRKK